MQRGSPDMSGLEGGESVPSKREWHIRLNFSSRFLLPFPVKSLSNVWLVDATPSIRFPFPSHLLKESHPHINLFHSLHKTNIHLLMLSVSTLQPSVSMLSTSRYSVFVEWGRGEPTQASIQAGLEGASARWGDFAG